MTNAQVPIACWGGRLWVRISAQLYNELADYQRLADAVRELRHGEPASAAANRVALNGLPNGSATPTPLEQM